MESATRPTVSERGRTSATKLNRRSAVIAVVALFVIASAAGAYFYFTRARGGVIDSIAVLPFQNKSSDADTEYLSDGLAESLIYRLSQLPNLKVSPTSSVFRYKGKETDPIKIGNELGVNAVMSGRIVQRGESLTISVELVDVRNNKLLWGEQYDRKLADLLATQREIAAEITQKLQLKLSGEDQKGLNKRYTDNNEAYQLYLKGRFLWNKRTGESLKQAIEYYNQAIGKDPAFALAYSGLAETYVLFPSYDVASVEDAMPQAKAAAMRALALDDSLAEAHAALGGYLTQFEYDWAGGEREFRRAIELNRKYATAHQWLGELLTQTKRFDEGQAEMKRALEADPLSPIISFNIGQQLFLARRYDDALREFDRTVTFYPDFALSTSGLCWSYYEKRVFDQAIPACRKARELVPDAFNTGYLSLVLGRSGQREEARKLLDELKNDSLRRRDVPGVAIAFAHIGLDQKEEAMAMLQKEVDAHGYWASRFAVQPELDEFRADPRFKAMLRRMNLPQ
jgi:TolB-like protein